MLENIFAYRTELSHDCLVGIAQDCQSKPFQILVSFLIGCLSLLFIMLGSIQLNDKLLFVTVKICDIVSDDLLSAEVDRERTQKIVPKVPLFFCHVFPERPGILEECFILFDFHSSPLSPSVRTGHFPLRGKQGCLLSTNLDFTILSPKGQDKTFFIHILVL